MKKIISFVMTFIFALGMINMPDIYAAGGNAEYGIIKPAESNDIINIIDDSETDFDDSEQSVTPTVKKPVEYERGAAPGELNNDGTVSMPDVVLLQRFLAKLVKFSDKQTKAADVTADNKISMDDVVLIQKYIAELITAFNLEKYAIGVDFKVASPQRTKDHAGISNASQFLDEQGNFCIAVEKDNKFIVYKIFNGKFKKIISIDNTAENGKKYLGSAICDSDGNIYLILGRTNNTNDTSVSTIFINKYSREGNFIASAEGNGSEGLAAEYNDSYYTKKPFENGNCDVSISGDLIAVNYARLMYNGNQSNTVFVVNRNTMQVDHGIQIYNSHSFDQRITPYSKTNGFITESQGDSNNRAFTASLTKKTEVINNLDTFEFWVESGADDRNDNNQISKTRARLGNILETSTGAALVGSSARSLSQECKNEPYDVFVQIFDPTKSASEKETYITQGTRSGTAGKNGDKQTTNYGVKWLTDNKEIECFADVVQAVSVNDDAFVILYELYRDNSIYESTWYMIVDSLGNVIQDASLLRNTRLNPDEDPLYADGSVQWAANSKSGELKHYKLNINITPKTSSGSDNQKDTEVEDETSNLEQYQLDIDHTVESTGWRKTWSGISNTSQFADEQGNFCMAIDNGSKFSVYKISNGTIKDVINIDNPNEGSFGRKTLGSAICDSSGNIYLVLGRNNTSNDRSVNTIFINKYSGNGKLIASVGGNGSEGMQSVNDSSFNTKTPFISGNCDVAICGDYIAVNYSRLMYNGHQCNGVFVVNKNTMQPDLKMKSYYSHSFDQRITAYSKTNGFILESHGDAYNRAFTTSLTNKTNVINSMDTFEFWLERGAGNDSILPNYTRARLGNILEVSTGAALVGSSARSLNESCKREPYDVFVQIFDPAKSASDINSYVTRGIRSGLAGKNGDVQTINYGVKWLTDNKSSQCYADVVQAVSVNADAFVVLYELYFDNDTRLYDSTWYMVVDSRGNIIKSASQLPNIRLNVDEDPIYANGYVQWVANDVKSGKLKLYKLAVDTSKNLSPTIGDDNIVVIDN